MANALIVSVGGSPQPLAKSIVYHKPKFVCFLASQDTISQISKVEEIVRKEWPDANYETYMVLLDDPKTSRSATPRRSSASRRQQAEASAPTTVWPRSRAAPG